MKKRVIEKPDVSAIIKEIISFPSIPTVSRKSTLSSELKTFEFTTHVEVSQRYPRQNSTRDTIYSCYSQNSYVSLNETRTILSLAN